MKYKCVICKQPISDESELVIKNNKIKVNGQMAAHYFGTHGIPPEVFAEAVNKYFVPPAIEGAIEICQFVAPKDPHMILTQ